MQRPEQHRINEEGELLLRTTLPRAWVVRKVEQSGDYGLDFEVEVFGDEQGGCHSTGFIFKVQLKSSAHTRYLSSDASVTVSLKRKHIAYYCREVNSPVIVIHADIVGRRLFWVAPQLDTSIAALGDRNSDKKVSLRIPAQNELPRALEAMLDAANKAASALATRLVIATPVPDFIDCIRGTIDIETAVRELRDRSDALRLSGLQDLFEAGQFEDAKKVINKILCDEDAAVENRFWAILEEERIEVTQLYRAQAPQGLVPDANLRIARKLQGLTRRGPAPLKLCALITRVAAELDVLCHRVYGLFLSVKLHEESGNDLWRTYAALEKTSAERLLWRKYDHAVRLARYVMNSPHRMAVPRALARVPGAIVVYLIVLDHESRTELASRYRQSAFQVLKLVEWIAARIREYETVQLAAGLAVQLSTSESDECYTWADSAISRIHDPAQRTTAERFLTRAKRRKAGIAQDGDIEACEKQIYENMATAVGIPLDDENHPLTRLFRRGVADANPTRILKNCKHMFVSMSRQSLMQAMLSEQLNLPIGPKKLECTRHGFVLLGGSLDSCYSEFASRHCNNCSDKEPHAEAWVYSDEWQVTQHERALEARARTAQQRRDRFATGRDENSSRD